MKTHTLLLSLIALAALATNATAQDPAPAEAAPAPEATAAPEATTAPEETSEATMTDKELEFRLTMYTWFSSLTNSVAVRNRDETVTDIPFSDIFKALDFANFAHMEVKKDKWILFSELDFIKLSDNAEFRRRGGIPFKIGADLALKQTTAELGVMRSFEGKRVALDALVGARYFRIDSDVHFGPLRSAATKDWVDPMIGARLRFNLSEKWNAAVRADFAGFGMGSELTTNAIAFMSYKISDRYDVGFGYRYMDVDYESSALKVDMETYGPVIGMGINF